MQLHDTHGGYVPPLDDGPAFELGDGTRLPPGGAPSGPPHPSMPDPMAAGMGAGSPDAGGADLPAGPGDPGAGDPAQARLHQLVHDLAEREHLVAQIISEIDAALGGLHGNDVHTLHQMLRAPDMTPAALRSLHSNGLLVTHAKGLAYDRLASGSGGGQSPAPVTPGGGASRDGLSVAELRQIKELAPRLNVPVEELKAQYAARKRQSA
jgi:hypothetical protein